MAFAHVVTVVVAVSLVSVGVVVSVRMVVGLYVIVGVVCTLVCWMVILVVRVIVIKSIIVLVVVVSGIGVSVIRVVLVVEITVVVVLTTLTTPPLIAYTVSALVQAGMLHALNAVVCTWVGATIAALIAAVVSVLGAGSNVVVAFEARPVVVALAFAVGVFGGVSDTVFTVTGSRASTAVAHLIA